MANEQEIKNGIITPIVKLQERTTPSVDAGKGQVYTKSSDNKLWFVDSLGIDKEIGLDNDTYDYYVLNNLATDHLNWLDLKQALENPAYNSVFINSGTYYAEDDAGADTRAIYNVTPNGQRIVGSNLGQVKIDCSNLTSATTTVFSIYYKSSCENILISNFDISSAVNISAFSGGKYHKNLQSSYSSNSGAGRFIDFNNINYSADLSASSGDISYYGCNRITNSISAGGTVINSKFFSNCRFEHDGDEVNMIEDCNNFTNSHIWGNETATVFSNCNHMVNTTFDALYITQAADAFLNCNHIDGLEINSCTLYSTNYLFNNCENISNVIVNGAGSVNGIINCKNISNIKLSNFEGCPLQYSDHISNVELIGNWSGLTSNLNNGHIYNCSNVKNAYIEPALIVAGWRVSAIYGDSANQSINYDSIEIIADPSSDKRFYLGLRYIDNVSNLIIKNCVFGIKNCNNISNLLIEDSYGAAIDECNNVKNARLIGNWSGLTSTNLSYGHIYKSNNISDTYIEPAILASGYYAVAVLGDATSKNSEYNNIEIFADPSSNKRFGMGMQYIKNINNVNIYNCEQYGLYTCDNIENGIIDGNWNSLVSTSKKGHVDSCSNVSNIDITPPINVGGFSANGISSIKNCRNITIIAEPSSNKRFNSGMRAVTEFENITIEGCESEGLTLCENGNNITLNQNRNTIPVSKKEHGHIENCKNINNISITPSEQSSVSPIDVTTTTYDFESNTPGDIGTTAWGADWTLSATGSFLITDFLISDSATPSVNTGPTGEALSNRGNFLFIEASGNPGSGVAEYSGASWDKLTSLSFYYHSYSGLTPTEIAQMGDIVIYSKNSDNVWTEMWRQADRRQTSPEQPFEKITLDTKSWDSIGIRIAFENIESFHSDICIDDIVFETASHVTSGVVSCENISNLSIIGDSQNDYFIGDGVYNSKNIQGYIEDCSYNGISFTDEISKTEISKCSIGINNCNKISGLSIDSCTNEGVLYSRDIDVLNLKECAIGINESDEISNIKYEDMRGVVFKNSNNLSNIKGDDYTKTYYNTLFESCKNITNVKVNINMKYGRWVASTDYGSNDGVNKWVVPTTPASHIYKNTSLTGVSGSTEPTWPTTAGQTVVDGTITWEAYPYVSLIGLGFGMLFSGCSNISNIDITSENSNSTEESLLILFTQCFGVSDIRIDYQHAYAQPIIGFAVYNISNVLAFISASHGSSMTDHEIFVQTFNVSNVTIYATYTEVLLDKTYTFISRSGSLNNVELVVSFEGNSMAASFNLFDDCEKLSNIKGTVKLLTVTNNEIISILNSCSKISDCVFEFKDITSDVTTPSEMVRANSKNIKGVELIGTNITNTTYGFNGGNQVIGCYGVDNGDFDVAADLFIHSGFNNFS